MSDKMICLTVITVLSVISRYIIFKIRVKLTHALQYVNKFSPMSHLFPAYPGTHLQSYPFTRSVHVAPFLHGLLEHSFVSKKNRNDFVNVYMIIV